MKFEETTTSIIKVKKHGHLITKEYVVFINSTFPFFGIVEKPWDPQFCWALAHLISEQVLTDVFRSKEEVEAYFDFLMQETDLNSILLCHPNYEYVRQELKLDAEIAYKKYIRHKMQKQAELA